MNIHDKWTDDGKDDTIRELRKELLRAKQRIAELECSLEFEMNITRDAIKAKNHRIEELETALKRVLDEGWSSWSDSSSDIEIHWSIPKELERKIAKELSDDYRNANR